MAKMIRPIACMMAVLLAGSGLRADSPNAPNRQTRVSSKAPDPSTDSDRESSSLRQAWAKRYEREAAIQRAHERRTQLADLLQQAKLQVQISARRTSSTRKYPEIVTTSLPTITEEKPSLTVAPPAATPTRLPKVEETLAIPEPQPMRLGSVAKLHGDNNWIRKRIIQSLATKPGDTDSYDSTIPNPKPGRPPLWLTGFHPN